MKFTNEEMQTILNALRAVSPTGGGSPQFHLAYRIEQETKLAANWETIAQMQEVAHTEHQEFLDANAE